ncbi:MAG: 2-hydroxyacyl-CoA dehydratase [Clostridiales bacterium]|nr:2-hydroxyacyl-CoA dehydratase [Clostridiales bacterium]
MEQVFDIGLDIGSTTVKVVILNECEIVYKSYIRHYSDVKNTVISTFKNIHPIIKDKIIKLNITGSGGFEVANVLGVDFVQEVIASAEAVEKLIPDTDVSIELGGEDAKITYFGESVEQRMNGTCAGGTGAFIDQMASLLKTDAEGLNELAKGYQQIYPIASRCGVFAKTDVQPLLNEGAAKEDIAVSVLQAIVNQTIGGLAQGRPIRGTIAFLGGPLSFLSELRKRFIETLNLDDAHVRFPDNAQYFVALGVAYAAKKTKIIKVEELYKNIKEIGKVANEGTSVMEALFADNNDYETFLKRHGKNKVERNEIENYKGKAFLGIDSGSTTTKVVLIDEEGKMLFSYYGSNLGRPLHSTINVLKDLNKKLNEEIEICNSTVTGYGEQLIKAAIKVDIGEIETIAHYKAADFFVPGVDFILDIGGQDMKSLQIRNGTVHSIMLNEACSSGCGSFIETFAESLDLDIHQFTKKAVESKKPVDLGTRCTVFMNSKVKQAQKEGVEVSDIAAGISMSVIKNALFKVIRMKLADDLGDKIVVQGGTFYNDAVLRSFERLAGKEVIRPDIAGIMGAFGAALIAKERYEETYVSTLLDSDHLDTFKVTQAFKRCGLCANNCALTVNQFSDGREFITGNRCEKGAATHEEKRELPNLYEYKYKKIFDYKNLSKEEAYRGEIGFPRVLNLYEDYPFWHTLFTELGYKIVLSGRSSKKIFELGMESIPSESVCYPAKLVHGHIQQLIKRGVSKIFYPAIVYNIKEDPNAGNSYNCPVVTSYSETIKANVEELKSDKIIYYNPFLPLDDEKRFVQRFYEEMKCEGLNKSEIKIAAEKAYKELFKYKKDIQQEGEKTLAYLKENGLKGIVLAGRPYHIDPEINHGIPELVISLGYAVLSEDSVSHLSTTERPLRVIDQWVYHSRLYAAATFTAQQENLEFIQLNSFGCGLDAVTVDQVQEILERYNRVHTVIKIDEINNLGAARIRLRSLLASVKERELIGIKPYRKSEVDNRVVFTKAMKKNHTIISPQMAPIHFELLEKAFINAGYNLVILKRVNKNAIDTGLKYVHNDACYPAVITVGQVMAALESGEYDLNNTSLIISQTGGGCRATNYIAFIRKALKDAGMQHIPVISLSAQNMENNPGFKLTLPLIKAAIRALVYGDLMMRVLYKVRPYEKFNNSANQLYNKWMNKLKDSILSDGDKAFKENIRMIVKEFDELEIHENLVKPKVGIVGEILVKYHPDANNNIVDVIEKEGAEVIVPDLIDFFLYSAYNNTYKYEKLSGSWTSKKISDLAIAYIESYRTELKKALNESKRFHPPKSIQEMAEGAEGIISLGNQTGEGWFLTAEMIELIDEGVPNIFCIQPFGCLPNHVVGKGMIKKLRDSFPQSNIVAIDYDSGASEVNQLNRIKLMMSMAFKNLEKGNKNLDFSMSNVIEKIKVL